MIEDFFFFSLSPIGTQIWRGRGGLWDIGSCVIARCVTDRDDTQSEEHRSPDVQEFRHFLHVSVHLPPSLHMDPSWLINGRLSAAETRLRAGEADLMGGLDQHEPGDSLFLSLMTLPMSSVASQQRETNGGAGPAVARKQKLRHCRLRELNGEREENPSCGRMETDSERDLPTTAAGEKPLQRGQRLAAALNATQQLQPAQSREGKGPDQVPK